MLETSRRSLCAIGPRTTNGRVKRSPEIFTSGCGEALHGCEVERFASFEHLHLQPWPIVIELVHLGASHWLNDPMDVPGHGIRMRPERHVYLFR